MSTTLDTPAVDMPATNPNRTWVWARRALIVTVWIGAIVAWRQYESSTGLGTTGVAQRFIDDVDMVWWGLAAYVAVYLVRPIVLFPASVLTVVAGILFGPVVGVAVVIVASNASAMIAYAIGRALGHAPGAGGDSAAEGASLARRWSQQMRDNSFETVLVMRLLFLPYDLVNYLSGILRIKWFPFLAATALGSLPGTVSFVLIGASLERVDMGFGGIDRVALGAGLAIFAVSLAGARMLRKRRAAT